MSVGDWLVTFLLMWIPLVNIILLFVWAFGGDTRLSRKTWAQATLILLVVIPVLWFFFLGSVFATLGMM